MSARTKKKNAAAPKPPPTRARRVFFATFKWCRISVLLVVLIVIILGLFLNKVGLPVSLQQRVIDQARARGWDLEFSRLRWRWYRGLVAEDLSLRLTNAPVGPQMFFETAELSPSFRALTRLRFQIDAVRLAGGRLVWPTTATNRPAAGFTLEQIGGVLLFKPNDEWELSALDATLFGAHVHVRGDLTNATFLRDWRLPSFPPPKPGEEALWQRLVAESRKVRFAAAPDLGVIFSVDARAPRASSATLKFIVPAVESPWADATDLRLSGSLVPQPGADAAIHAEFKLTAAGAYGAWGSGTNLELNFALDPSFTQLIPTNASAMLEMQSVRTRWVEGRRLAVNFRCQPSPANAGLRDTQINLTADEAGGEWGKADRVVMTGVFSHNSTNLLPANLQTAIQLASPRTRWATSDWARVEFGADLPAAADLLLFRTNVVWPDRWTNISFFATATLSNVHAWKLNLDSVLFTNRWQPPRLITDWDARLWDGNLTGSTDLDTKSRLISFNGGGRFRPRKLAPLLDTNAQELLAAHESDGLLRLQAAGSATLPEWTNQRPDRLEEVLPTLSLSGMIEADRGAYRGVAYDSAHALFHFTNSLLNVPELKITRPEGAVTADYAGNERTGDFRCRLRSTIDPKALDPLIHREGKDDVMDLFQFTRPPVLDAMLSGNRRDWKRLGMDAEVALTNVSFRGQSVSACVTRVLYTNKFISILRPLVLREGERGQADGIGIDVAKPRLYLTNATGNITPFVIARAIGPGTYRDVAPYVFDIAPMARVSGSIPLGRSDGSEDLRFEVEGGPFHWRKFNLDQIRGTVLWRGNTVAVTNVQGRWCGGDVAGWVYVDFAPTNTDLLSFHALAQNTSLKSIVTQLGPPRTNRLEGLLGGELFITRAELNNDRSWQGYGFAHLTNGLIWDIPLFGVFSPVLNAFIPGLGNSRAKHAGTTFDITNSVIQSRDLEIRAGLMRMQFKGSVDFEQRVEGRMEAEMLRGLPAVGFVLSKVLWPVTKLFEYKVTGTLGDPKTEQLFVISRVLLFPFQPIKTIRDLFEPDKKTEEKPPAAAPTPEP